MTNAVEMMVFISYICSSEIKEAFLFCHSVPTRSTTEELFKNLNQYMTDKNIEWNRCVKIYMDGAKIMTERSSGLLGQMNAAALGDTRQMQY